ncbi:GUN4 domain-containing protein [Phormidesmis sp. 146-12]
MANNWAIVIGINQYEFLQPLKYAKRDAEMMHNFLRQEAGFNNIFLFTDDSPDVNRKRTKPFRANLLQVLRQIFAAPFMQDGDNFWFFFSGHGVPHKGQDYLMPLDGDPEDIENTGISTNTITNYLRSCGADNAVMILDACRSGGQKSGEGIGKQTEAEARQTGVISLFSCSPDQYSYELEAIEQGAFTYALIEGLGIRGRCATVERLNQYLEHRVPELISQHVGRVRQTPYTIAEPLNRSHLILMPQHASSIDIATLKNDAYRAERTQDWDLAQRLWIRVLAASGSDMEAIEALQNLGMQRRARTAIPSPEPPQTTASSRASQPHTPPSLSRRQFFKWAVPAGVGVVGVTIASQLIKLPSQPTSSSPSSPLPSPSPSPSFSPSSPLPSPSPFPSSPASPLSFPPVDYSKLEGLLKTGKWEDADQETNNLMLRVANREKERWLNPETIQKFPCEVLSKIDQLWVANSDGKFGFSAQKKIYVEDCGGKPDGQYDEKAWFCFGDQVGWRVNNQWIVYRNVTFDTKARDGHLPVVLSISGFNLGWWWGIGDDEGEKSSLVQKLVNCRI